MKKFFLAAFAVVSFSAMAQVSDFQYSKYALYGTIHVMNFGTTNQVMLKVGNDQQASRYSSMVYLYQTANATSFNLEAYVGRERRKTVGSTLIYYGMDGGLSTSGYLSDPTGGSYNSAGLHARPFFGLDIPLTKHLVVGAEIITVASFDLSWTSSEVTTNLSLYSGNNTATLKLGYHF